MPVLIAGRLAGRIDDVKRGGEERGGDDVRFGRGADDKEERLQLTTLFPTVSVLYCVCLGGSAN